VPVVAQMHEATPYGVMGPTSSGVMSGSMGHMGSNGSGIVGSIGNVAMGNGHGMGGSVLPSGHWPSQFLAQDSANLSMLGYLANMDPNGSGGSLRSHLMHAPGVNGHVPAVDGANGAGAYPMPPGVQIGELSSGSLWLAAQAAFMANQHQFPVRSGTGSGDSGGMGSGELSAMMLAAQTAGHPWAQGSHPWAAAQAIGSGHLAGMAPHLNGFGLDATRSMGSIGSMEPIREVPGAARHTWGPVLNGTPHRLEELDDSPSVKRARMHQNDGFVAEGPRGTSLVRPFHRWGSNTRQLVMLRQYWYPGALGFTAADMERLKRHCGLEISSSKKSLKRHKAKCEKKECLSVFIRFALLGPPMVDWEWGHPVVRESARKNDPSSIEFLKNLREAQVWFLGRAKVLVEKLCGNLELARAEIDPVVEGGWAAFTQTVHVTERLKKDLRWIHSELVKDIGDISSILAYSENTSTKMTRPGVSQGAAAVGRSILTSTEDPPRKAVAAGTAV